MLILSRYALSSSSSMVLILVAVHSSDSESESSCSRASSLAALDVDPELDGGSLGAAALGSVQNCEFGSGMAFTMP